MFLLNIFFSHCFVQIKAIILHEVDRKGFHLGPLALTFYSPIFVVRVLEMPCSHLESPKTKRCEENRNSL